MDELDVTPLQEALLLANLGHFDSALPEPLQAHFTNLLRQAMLALRNDCNIDLDPENEEDAGLSAMYAAWLYRKSATGEAKPPMLQTAIRNRQSRQAKDRRETE